MVEGLADLPLGRARSDAETRALEVLALDGRPLPELNRVIAGREVDLSWPAHRLIVEIDGPQFHLDPAEDDRRQAPWVRAGWTVHRLPSGAVFDAPERLLGLAPASNVAQAGPGAVLSDVRRGGRAG